MSTSHEDHLDWLQHPTGKIPKNSYCRVCGRFNARNTAVNAVLLIDGKTLLVKRAQNPQQGNWDIPGGYLDWDETLQQAASRELLEETGLIVPANEWKMFDIFSQPNNAAGNQVIDIYFIATNYSGTMILDPNEVQEAQWFELAGLPENVAFDHMLALRKLLQMQK